MIDWVVPCYMGLKDKFLLKFTLGKHVFKMAANFIVNDYFNFLWIGIGRSSCMNRSYTPLISEIGVQWCKVSSFRAIFSSRPEQISMNKNNQDLAAILEN